MFEFKFLYLTTRFEPVLVNLPVLEVSAEGHNAHLVDHVELVGAVKVEYGLEGARVAVEEVLVLGEGVGVAQVQDFLVRGRVGQPAQPGSWPSCQSFPKNLVFVTAHIERNALVDLLASFNHKRRRRHF